jgi:head-tail adaptor
MLLPSISSDDIRNYAYKYWRKRIRVPQDRFISMPDKQRCAYIKWIAAWHDVGRTWADIKGKHERVKHENANQV